MLKMDKRSILERLQSSANIFESKIYPTDRATFGSEWTPGIDDDVHLTILNAVGLGNNVGGYFTAQDEYPTSVNPLQQRARNVLCQPGWPDSW